MIVSTKELFAHAYGKYAVGAYNINNAEQVMGLFRGNIDSKAPFIIQLSKGARSYTDKRLLEAMIRAADEIFPEAVFAVHLDHGDEEACMDCIASGFYSSVMIDASAESFEDNILNAGAAVYFNIRAVQQVQSIINDVIEAHELIPENLDSLNSINSFLQKKNA